VIHRRRRVLTLLAACSICCYAGFTLLGRPCRRAETWLALSIMGRPRWVTAMAGVTRSDFRRGQTVRIRFSTLSSLFRVASGRGLVSVSYTSYSSSLIALTAVACCGLFIVRAPRLRRYAAVAISASAVLVWSSLRLAGSFWLVHLLGSPVAWLFDDWFGVLLVLVDTALGYHMLIWLLLPGKRAT